MSSSSVHPIVFTHWTPLGYNKNTAKRIISCCCCCFCLSHLVGVRITYTLNTRCYDTALHILLYGTISNDLFSFRFLFIRYILVYKIWFIWIIHRRSRQIYTICSTTTSTIFMYTFIFWRFFFCLSSSFLFLCVYVFATRNYLNWFSIKLLNTSFCSELFLAYDFAFFTKINICRER